MGKELFNIFPVIPCVGQIRLVSIIHTCWPESLNGFRIHNALWILFDQTTKNLRKMITSSIRDNKDWDCIEGFNEIGSSWTDYNWEVWNQPFGLITQLNIIIFVPGLILWFFYSSCLKSIEQIGNRKLAASLNERFCVFHKTEYIVTVPFIWGLHFVCQTIHFSEILY